MPNFTHRLALGALMIALFWGISCAAFIDTYRLIDLGLQPQGLPQLSRNGRFVVFHTPPTLTRVDLVAGTTFVSIPLSLDEERFALSSDGDRVAYEDGGISLYNFSTNSAQLLLADNSVASITLSGNGRRIAFRSTADRGANPDGSDEWFILDIPSSDLQQITDSQPAPVNLSSQPGSFSEDGSRFAFNGDFGNAVPILGLWEEGLGTRNLDQQGASYAWVTLNAAGDFICFVSTQDLVGQNPNHYGEIFGYDVQTDTFSQISHATQNPFATSEKLAFSGNGQRIYYATNGNYDGAHADVALWSFDRQGNVCVVSDALPFELSTDDTGQSVLFWRDVAGERLFLASSAPTVPTLSNVGLAALIALLLAAAIYLRNASPAKRVV